MALAGSLLAISLLLGADPADGEQADSPGSVAPSLSPAPESIVRPGFPPGGWSVSDVESPPAPVQRPPGEGEAFPAEPRDVGDARRGGDDGSSRASDAAAPLKLAPPTKTDEKGESAAAPPSSAGALTSVISSLAVVLGLFFVVVWMAKRNSPKGAMLLPSEVVEVLGRTPLTSRQQMHVVRFGNKLLLLSVTPGGAEPLAEIEDPAEVERLTGVCQELQSGSITETFRQVFSQFGNEPTQDSFVGAARDR